MKRTEYANAGIREYWVVDPRDETITVLVLTKRGKSYAVAGTYHRGDQAQSVLLSRLAIDVNGVFDSAAD